MPLEDEQILVARLLSDAEAANVERTESLSNNDKFCEAVCAFANDMPGSGRSGYLLIGADSAGKPTGATITEKLLTTLSTLFMSGQILPPPVFSVSKVTVGESAIAVVRVEPSDAPPVRYKGQVCIRRGPSRGIATAEEERRLTERRIDRAKTWDTRGCDGAKLDDLALDLFTLNYLPQAVSPQVLQENGRSTPEQLAGLRFYDTRSSLPTNGAVLLFGKDPLGHVPCAYVQYVRYAGTDMASDVEDERRFSGDLRQVLEGLDQLARAVSRPRPIRNADLTDATVFDYPPVSLHELLMNAVIHRNYEHSGSPVSINHFQDRIEIQSPGGLFGDLTRDRFPNATSYRNPVLAEAARVLGFANMFGRGIAIARKLLSENRNPEPRPEVGDNHLAWTIGVRP